MVVERRFIIYNFVFLFVFLFVSYPQCYVVIYYRYSSETRAEIGKHASVHGVTAAANLFSQRLGEKISLTTVRSIRDAYTTELRRKRKASDSDAVVLKLPEKKRGMHVLLGDYLDEKVQLYIKKVRERGGVVTARIAMAAARGILLSYDKHKLQEFGGNICITRDWAYSLLTRMGYVTRKASTAKSKYSVTHFDELKKQFLEDVKVIVQFEEIPSELVLNWDQTGIKMVPTGLYTMEKEGAKRIEIIGASDKRQITAVFCCSLIGDFLPIQLIYGGKTERCHPKFEFPGDWHITHSMKHWSNEETMLQYVREIIVPYVEHTRQGRDVAALVIMDNFKGQITDDLLSLLDDHNIHHCLLPANTTDLLQPLDISVNKPAKQFLKNKFEQWYADQIMQQIQGRRDVGEVELNPIDLSLPCLKELGAQWLVEMAEYISDNPQFITNGFFKAGIPQAIDGKPFGNDVETDNLSEDDLISEAELELSDDFSDVELVL